MGDGTIVEPVSVAGLFGWHRRFDPAEAQYPATKLRLAAAKTRYWYYRTPRVLDGRESNSVAMAWHGWLETALGREVGPIDALPDQHTLHGGARVLREQGLLSAYHWTRDVSMVKRAIYHLGPVMVGTSWLAGMLQPGVDGAVDVNGGVVGAAAWVVVGYDPGRRAFRGLQSWGAGWGQVGRFWIAEDALRPLIDEGVACLPVLA